MGMVYVMCAEDETKLQDLAGCNDGISAFPDHRDEDYGYGPPMMLSVAEVQKFSAFVQQLTYETVPARYDPDKIQKADVYPSAEWMRNDPEDRTWVLNDVKRLRKFISSIARQGKAILWLVC